MDPPRAEAGAWSLLGTGPCVTLVGMDITFATCCGRLCGFAIDYRILFVSIHICMNACHLCGGPLCMLGSSNLCYLCYTLHLLAQIA